MSKIDSYSISHSEFHGVLLHFIEGVHVHSFNITDNHGIGVFIGRKGITQESLSRMAHLSNVSIGVIKGRF